MEVCHIFANMFSKPSVADLSYVGKGSMRHGGLVTTSYLGILSFTINDSQFQIPYLNRRVWIVTVYKRLEAFLDVCRLDRENNKI